MLPRLGQKLHASTTFVWKHSVILGMSLCFGFLASVFLLLAVSSYSVFPPIGGQLSGTKTTTDKSLGKPQTTESYFSFSNLFGRSRTDGLAEQLKNAEITYEMHMKQREKSAAYFAMQYFIPVYPCTAEVHVGAWGEGGKWVCNTKGAISKTGIVYSIGSNGDPGFEESMFDIFQLKSYTFDPTLGPNQLKAVNNLPYVKFYDIGLTSSEESGDPRMMNIVQIMRLLNHTYIDIFKIDCEGCEISFLQHLKTVGSRNAPLFGQMQMEVHNPDRAVMAPMIETLEGLGYRLFHVEPNFEAIPCCWELAFIHESLTLV